MSGMNDLTIKLGLDDSSLPAPVQRVNSAIASIGQTGVVSARQTAAAMRQLPAQFTDIATQLAGGQNPLLILMQQGGQIKDSFGGIGPAIGALGTFITPVAVAVGAAALVVGTFALAAHQGAQETKTLRDMLAMSGNAAGLTGARFTAVAEQVASATQQTVGGAREILLSLASSGQVSNRVLDAMAIAVGRVADVTGGDSKKISADFAGMAGGVAKWAAEHNKAWNFITVEQYKYIRRLEEQGKAEQAMIFVSEQVTRHTAEQSKNLGTLERAWANVGKMASGAWDSMLGLGRAETTQAKLEDATRRLQQLPLPGAGFRGLAERRAKIEQEMQLLKGQLELENQQADARSSNAQRTREEIEKERKAESAGVKKEGKKDKLEPPVWFDVLDSKDARIKMWREAEAEDEKGAQVFIRRQLELQAARDEQRLTKDNEFVLQLRDANNRATIELLKNERERGEALIALDHDIATRRLSAQQGMGDGARAQAQQEIDRKAQLSTQALKLADDTGKATYEGVHGALQAAFRDTSNPLRAFGNALANTIYTRASASLIDALSVAGVGRSGAGGGLGSLLSLINTFAGTYGGSSTDVSASNYENSFDRMNVPKLAAGTNYVPRNMLAGLHEGEAVVPRQYNPAAGGGAGVAVNQTVNVHIDARADQEQVARMVYGAVQQGNEALLDDLRARGALA